MIATVAGITCLMRATVGDIVAAEAGDLASGLLDECTAIAAAHGFAPPRSDDRSATGPWSRTPGSTFAASMLRDIERGAPIEADHIVGDLLRRGEQAPRDYHFFASPTRI